MKTVLGRFYDKFLLISVLFVTLTFFILGPSTLFFSNRSEFWFRWSDLLISVVPWFLLAVFLVFLIGQILPYKIKKVYINMLTGVGLGLYIQGYFIQADYGLLDGRTIDWSLYHKTAIINSFCWVFCIIVPFLVSIFLPKISNKIIYYISITLIAIQIVSLGITIINVMVRDVGSSNNSGVYISDDGLYSLGEKDNAVVFILDALDQDYFKQVMEEYPEKLNFLDGFTYYDNMTCAYPTTIASIPYLLTGERYENEVKFKDYISKAWNDVGYYSILKQNGYDIGVYTKGYSLISDNAAADWIDNASVGNVKVSSYNDLTRNIFKLTGFRFFPHIAKKYVTLDSAVFDNLKKGSSNHVLYSNLLSDYYNTLNSEGIQLKGEHSFRFIHLEGVHKYYTYMEDLSLNEESASAYTETLACMTIMSEYVNQLKELGIYDETCIIITADHGDTAMQKTSPVLLVKGKNQRGELRTDFTPVSQDNIMGTVMSELSLNESHQFGYSVYDDADIRPEERRYLLYSGVEPNDSYLPDMIEYTINSSGNEDEDYIQTGKIYTRNGVVETTPYLYNLGEEIYMTSDRGDDNVLSFKEHFVKGVFWLPEGDMGMSWSIGDESIVKFNLNEVSGKSFKGHIGLKYVYKGNQRVIIQCKGQTIWDGRVTSDSMDIDFYVPNDLVDDGNLTLKLKYPDASSPKDDEGSSDDRVLAIAFTSFILDEIHDDTALDIDFTDKGNSLNYVVCGWHQTEQVGTWTNGEGTLYLPLKKKGNYNIIVKDEIYGLTGETSVYYNDVLIGKLNDVDNMMLLPEEYQKEDGLQKITFITSNPCAPIDSEINSTDSRVLGILLKEISIEPESE